jgi:hypothetical protein
MPTEENSVRNNSPSLDSSTAFAPHFQPFTLHTLAPACGSRHFTRSRQSLAFRLDSPPHYLALVPSCQHSANPFDMKPRDYCCCAIPVVNVGIYATLTEQFVLGVMVGLLSLVTPHSQLYVPLTSCVLLNFVDQSWARPLHQSLGG